MSAYRALADTPVALSDVRSWWQVDIERVSLSQLFLSQFIALAEIRIFLGVGRSRLDFRSAATIVIDQQACIPGQAGPRGGVI